jgi:Tfp pilus assembly protein PilX
LKSLKKRINEERGVAMITVIYMVAVLMMLGGGMFFVSNREQKMTQADYAGNRAFYHAEAGVESVIDMLNYAATEQQLTTLRPDSSPDGGYLMDPEPAFRQTPSNPIEMDVGDEKYTVWVDEVDENGEVCTNCGLTFSSSMEQNATAYLLITAEAQSNEGYRKLQQRVKLEASGFPLTLFIDGNVKANGTVNVTNQSLYVRGSLFGREKLNVSGTDLVTGNPAAVFATGEICAKANNLNSQIYDPESGLPTSYYDSSEYNYDRDHNGPTTPTVNTFSESELETKFATAGLTSAQLLMLKGMAQTDGYYINLQNGQISIDDSDLPIHDGNIVVYVEYSGGMPVNNEVDLRFSWPYGKAFVVVLNGSVKMEGQEMGNFEGMVYSPDGPITANGAGSGGNFNGILWGKSSGGQPGLTDIGNYDFRVTQDFFDDAPFFAWTVVRQTAWTEVDR